MPKAIGLTIKQKRFVEEVIKTGNATESASRVYNTKNRVVAGSIGTENLKKPLIKELIEHTEQERLKVAKDMIYTIATTGEKEETRIKACQDIIDRTEGKPTQRIITDQMISLNIEGASNEELIGMLKK